LTTADSNTAFQVIVATGEIDLAATLDGGQAFRWWKDGAGYRGVIAGRLVRLSEGDDDVVVEALDGCGVDGLSDTVFEYLGGGLDIDELCAEFAADPCIGPAISGFAGLRLLRQDPWECLVSFITSSTSNIPRIKLNVGSMARLGRAIGPGQHDYEFPSAEVLAAAGEQQLRDLGLGFRAKYIIPAAEAVAVGRLDLDGLRAASYEDARHALVALPGIGEKVADCVLAFSLDKPEAFPIDRHIRRALENWYGLPPKLNNSKASDWARLRFGNRGAIAQQFMFHRERLAHRASSWGGRHLEDALPQDRVNGKVTAR
jgi:N-glycosylase/DNA lyase